MHIVFTVGTELFPLKKFSVISKLMNYARHVMGEDNLTKMSGDEFVTKLLSGEKDLRHIYVEDWFDLSGHDGFGELNEYFRSEYAGRRRLADAQCKKEDTGYCMDGGGLPMVDHDERVDISGSRIMHMNARGLYMPFLIAQGSQLSYSDFSSGILDFSDFFGSAMASVLMRDARIRKCNFSGCYMPMSDFMHARARGSDFSHSDIEDSIMFYINAPYSFWNGAEMNKGTNFYRAVITCADFDKSRIDSSIFQKVMGENAKFNHVYVAGLPDFSYSFIKNAKFTGTDTKSIKTTGAFVAGTPFEQSYDDPQIIERKPELFPRLNIETGKTEWDEGDPHVQYRIEAAIRMISYMNGLPCTFDT